MFNQVPHGNDVKGVVLKAGRGQCAFNHLETGLLGSIRCPAGGFNTPSVPTVLRRDFDEHTYVTTHIKQSLSISRWRDLFKRA